ncbi:MAG: outer membrane beta-barrel protein [Bacteroidia bacterium]
MVLKNFITIFLLLCISITANAQNKVRGKVLDEKNNPVSFCALALLNASDSVSVKGGITNEDGDFEIENIKPGPYFLKVSNVGFRDTSSAVIIVDSAGETVLETIVLKSNAVNLNEVSITAIKRPIEFKNGNITLNIEGSPLASGNSVYDLLKKLPGVTIDNDVISIQGKQGARVLIDDRIQQFSGAQLMAILKGISASNVEKIEILKNPPVKYDASGNAGLINIITKKIKLTGFSGSANAAVQQGFYGTQIAGLNLNYKGRKISFFSGFTVNNDIRQIRNHFERKLSDSLHTISFDQNSAEKSGGFTANIFAGADWFIDSKNTVGVRIEDMPGSTARTRIGNNTVSDTLLGYKRLDFTGTIPNTWNVVYTNINAEHLFDTVGTKLKFNADYYGPFYDIYGGDYKNSFYNGNGLTAMPPQNFTNTNVLKFSTLLARLDFEKKFKKDLSLEAGAKGSFQDMHSDYVMKVFDNNSQQYVTDSNFTNQFVYKEQILAAYLNLQKQIKKINLQAGVRVENTEVQTLSITSGIAFTRSYFNLFPTASISYTKNDKHNFMISYNRRIDRPDYNSFNPYRFFYGNLLSQGTGNPYLLPAYSNNYELSHNFKGSIANTISYSRVTNFIYGYPIQNTKDKTTISTVGNLNTFELYSYSLFVQKDIKKWWMININSTAFYFAFNGNINGTKFKDGAPAAFIYASNIITLPKNFKMEISGVYWSQWMNANNMFMPRGGIDIAVRKTLLEDKMNVSIGLNDVFFSLGTHTSSAYVTGQVYKTYNTYDTRRLIVNITYNFGKVKVQQRDLKQNEEKKRLVH